MTPISSSELFAINPVTGRLPSGATPLQSLVPGASLQLSYNPSPISPSYPKVPSVSGGDEWRFQQPLENAGGQIPVPNLNVNSQPYFDPYYPNESMIAERNYLLSRDLPKVGAGLNARGLSSSGLEGLANRSLTNYISSMAPALTPANAVAADLSGLYGAADVNQLIAKGELPGATPYPNVAPNPNAMLISSSQKGGPGYEIANGPMIDPMYSWSGATGINDSNFYKGQDYQTPQLQKSFGGWFSWLPNPFGGSTQGADQVYGATPIPGPGYFYNPTQQPGSLPWITGG